MTSSRLSDIDSFKIDDSMLSFIIFYEINIFQDLVLSQYILNVSINEAFSFNDYL